MAIAKKIDFFHYISIIRKIKGTKKKVRDLQIKRKVLYEYI